MQAVLAAPLVARKHIVTLVAIVLFAFLLCAAGSTEALDLVAFSGITGPLTSALTTLATLTPGIRAIVGVVGFVVAFISLAALRNFAPVLFYVGLAIFGSIGLVVAGAIMGATI